MVQVVCGFLCTFLDFGNRSQANSHACTFLCIACTCLLCHSRSRGEVRADTCESIAPTGVGQSAQQCAPYKVGTRKAQKPSKVYTLTSTVPNRMRNVPSSIAGEYWPLFWVLGRSRFRFLGGSCNCLYHGIMTLHVMGVAYARRIRETTSWIMSPGMCSY